MFLKKIFNHNGSKGFIQHHFSGAGFTLFELLIVILLVAVVGGISTIILVSSLRGSDRTNSVNKTRASGNYAITLMTKMIKYARSFDGVSTDGMAFSTAVSDCPASNPPPKSHAKITSIDGGVTTFSCIDSAPPVIDGQISSNSALLVDTEAVQIASCRITCIRNSFDPPTINIDFTLFAKSGSSFYEKQASIPFHASVTMRNF